MSGQLPPLSAVVPCAVLALLVGCGPPCDTGALGAIDGSNPDGAIGTVVGACGVDAGWWRDGVGSPPKEAAEAWGKTCSVPLGQLVRIEGREKAVDSCALPAPLSEDPTGWIYASGRPAAAAALAVWLPTQKADPALVTRVVQAVQGPSGIDEPLRLPTVPGASTEVGQPVLTVTPEGVFHAGKKRLVLTEGLAPPAKPHSRGPHPAWALDALRDLDGTEPVVALDQSVPVRTLRQVLASFYDAGAIRVLVSRGDGLGTVRVTLAPSWGEGAIDPNTATVGDALASAGAALALAFPGPAPCTQPPEGMVCVPGTEAVATYYIDRSETKNPAYRKCVADEACPAGTADGLTHEMAIRYCAWAGKRLPTDDEWVRAAGNHTLGLAYTEDGAPEWTRNLEWAEGGFPLRSGAGRVETLPPTARGGVRCAMTDPVYTRFPPRAKTQPLPVPPALEPPSAEMLALFNGVVVDDIEKKPLCTKGFSAGLDCRDPESYVVSNEPRMDIQYDYVLNRGGALVGVGTYQNYAYAAVARSQWVWLLDYDPTIVDTHAINRAFILAADTPEKFVAYFEPDNEAAAIQVLRDAYPERTDIEDLISVYQANLGQFRKYYRRELAAPVSYLSIGLIQVPPGDPRWGWLRNADHYQWVRTLWQQGRMKAMPGDMLADKTMRNIGAQARKMGVPVRIYYTSNAPTAWGARVTPGYRDNVNALPMDEHSLVLQVLLLPSGFGQTGWWHHSISDGRLHQQRLGRGYPRVYDTVYDRIKTDDEDLTLLGLPSD